ncbi:MAG: hypothetical protein ACYDH5_04385 [Acidimicrobiales bacterium]
MTRWLGRGLGWLAPEDRLVLALSLLIAAAVCSPFVGGRVLMLDFVSGPHVPYPPAQLFGLDGGVAAGLPLGVVVGGLFHLLGAAASWLVVGAFFPLAGLGISRGGGGGAPGRLLAATLFEVNPFVFERLYAGQVGILFGYALLAYLAASLLRASRRGFPRNLAPALWLAAATSMAPHFAWIGGVLLAAAVAADRFRPRAWAWAVGVGLSFVAMTSYVLFAHAGQALPIRTGPSSLAYFATQPSHRFGLYVNVAGLYGFWRLGPMLPKYLVSGWPILLAGILVVAGVGARAAFGYTRRRALVVLLVAGVVGYFLALGAQGPTGGVFSWAYSNVPFFAIMREPEKFSSLVALAYAACFGWGAQELLDRAAGMSSNPLGELATVTLCAALVVVYTPNLVAGLGGQVRPSHAPAAWRAANGLTVAGSGLPRGSRKTVAGPVGSGAVMFLPWHEYMAFPFTQRRVVANLGPDYFRLPVVTSTAPFSAAAAGPTSRRSAYLSYLLAHASHIHAFGALVAPLGIRYITLAKTVNWRAYGWLNHQVDLHRVLNTPSIEVFASTEAAAGGRVARLLHVANWGQLVWLADSGAAGRRAVSQAGIVCASPAPGAVVAPSGRAALAGPSTGRGARAGGQGTDPARRSSPVSWSIPAGPPGWVALPQAYEPSWSLGAHQAFESGVGTLLVRVGPDGGRLVFGHLRTVVLGYIVSAISAAAVVSAVVISGLRGAKA